MKAIRRSLKTDNQREVRQHGHSNSFQQKSAMAIVPPKKVIKALYDYKPQEGNNHELAFRKGDFFHVLSRENDTEWYEACNPGIPSARGLVPVAFFEVMDKQQRRSGNSGRSSGGHDSGFSEKGTSTLNHTRNESTNNAFASMSDPRKSSSGKNRPIVHGVVMYDFNAERPDELEARKGEPIVIVAQSNPEWFVAKPISRLGGPGLIPVSFVDIKDGGGRSYTDPVDAIRQAGIPRVEDWKKTAAEYKNSSISLGQLDPSQQNALTAGMERMNLQTGRPDGRQQQQQQSPRPYAQSPPHQQSPSQSLPQQQLPLAPVSASVPRYCFDNDTYWYIIEAQMEDGRWWELSRYYPDFYDFQIALLEKFPEEAGNKGKPRTLPFMPGPVANVTDAISNGRRQSLDEYIQKIVAMPPHISKSMLVRNLFKPKPGQDYEIDPNALNDDYRLSGQSLYPAQSHRSSGGTSQQNSAYSGVVPPLPTGSAWPGHRANPSFAGPNGSGLQPTLHTQASTLTQGSTGTSSSAQAHMGGGEMFRFKVLVNNEHLIVHCPAEVDFAQFQDKIRNKINVPDPISIFHIRGGRENRQRDRHDDQDEVGDPIENDADLDKLRDYATTVNFKSLKLAIKLRGYR